MFSSMKKEEYMESELSDISRVNVVSKNIVLEYLGTQREAVSAVWRLFLKKHKNIVNQTLHFSVFPVKQYTNLIYVKEKSFCLVNWAFLFVGPRGPISCGKVAKVFNTNEC